MLVLSRKYGESIILGNGLIKITVVRIADGKVRLGIEAPAEMPINREEVQEAIERDGRRGDVDTSSQPGTIES